MEKPIYAAAALAVMFLPGCDTTEDNYHLGDASDITLTTVPASQLRLTSDGTARQIEIKSNVNWTVWSDNNRFEVTPTSGKGNGTLTVTASNNLSTGNIPEGNITISADDFDKKVDIEVTQSKLFWDIISSSQETAPATGGEFSLRMESSIDWKLEVMDGDPSWMEFDTPLQGEGSFEPVTVTGRWTPNYSTDGRSVKFRLRPQDLSLEKDLPGTSDVWFNQRQATLPELTAFNLVGDVGLTDATLHLEYTSEMPVEEVGVDIRTSTALVRTVNVPVPEGGYPLTGSYDILVDGLDMKTKYYAQAFVTSKVGSTESSWYETFTTDVKYDGVEITDMRVTPDVASAEIIVSYTTDCGVGRAYLYLTPDGGKEQKYSPETLESPLVYKLTGLGQGLDYKAKVVITYYNPRESENIDVETNEVTFTTLRRLPGEDDNQPVKKPNQ